MMIGGKFSSRYKLKKLVYYEIFYDVRVAMNREKQIKGGSRMNKLHLIESLNPDPRRRLVEFACD